ncbi:uncharacterized protein LOC122531692 [Frieseomelitta varia]|uniref:uncharacterized protein LOC122531692 n=1 Tax=Frieseomelitta varia TaxID=561572 RepID=UPI001CB67C90|nr:uncharacterized protein LOC122531692 [Frieseomelitta varia]
MGLRNIARFQRVQGLHRNDRSTRRNFCWVLNKLQREPRILQRLLFTDESSFLSSNMLNPQNSRIWAHRNPHALFQRHNQGRFAINRRHSVYFMHDGVPPHNNRRCRPAPHIWPPRSPDLNLMDFFFVGSSERNCLPLGPMV